MSEIGIDNILEWIEDKRLELADKRKKRIGRIMEMTSKELAYEDEETRELNHRIRALNWLKTKIQKFASAYRT